MALNPEQLHNDALLFARQVHIGLNTAFSPLIKRENITVPSAILGCREFLAESLARVSAAHHTPQQAEDAFQGFVAALRRSVQRNIDLLRAGKDGKDLSWCPSADIVLEQYHSHISKKATKRKR